VSFVTSWLNSGTPWLRWTLLFLAWAGGTFAATRYTTGRMRVILGVGGTLIGAVLLGFTLGKFGEIMPNGGSDTPHARATDLMKVAVPLFAATGVFYEMHRIGQKRSIAERWKKLFGICLGIASIILYFNAFKFGYPKFYHRWDQYHYYMGAKYYPEIGYDGLYKCTAIAQDEIGKATVEVEPGKPRTFDFAAEVRKPTKTIRNLGGDNLLMKVDDLLAHPEECRSKFTPARWEQYKSDVEFFSSQCFLDNYWTDMQRDHGYNPPPVWTLAGGSLANLHGPGEVFRIGDDLPIYYTQILGFADILYILGMFAAIWWAFGWRVFSVGAILWGCQASAPAYWTLGAMLRQDWLFFFVLAACLARKRYHALSGASMVYSALLRIFPGLAIVGWLIVAGVHLVKKKTLTRAQLRTLIGGTAAAVVLVGASLAVVGKDSYQSFYKHTIEVHDQTPLTNHMGLRVLISHDLGNDKDSGRMRYTKDVKLVDPFETWKDMRLERYKDYKAVALVTVLASLAAFFVVLRRIKSLWVAQCMSQVWIILGSQLTCYYYVFMVLCAPLTRLRRDLEVWLFGFAAVSQIAWRALPYNDDKYTALTLLSLAVCWAMVFSFARRPGPRAAGAKAPSRFDLDGVTLAAAVAFVPGVFFSAMGAYRRDMSTILIGAGIAALGVAIKYLYKPAPLMRDAALPPPPPGGDLSEEA
jgi:hypothetical protein